MALFGLSGNPPTGPGGHGGIVAFLSSLGGIEIVHLDSGCCNLYSYCFFDAFSAVVGCCTPRKKLEASCGSIFGDMC